MNHSCRPNAQHSWNEKLQREVVHAVREIREGDELTLSYSAGGPSTVRKKEMKTYFGFDCACEVCSLPSEKLQASDARRKRAMELDEAIGNPKRVKQTPELALDDCHSLLEIYYEEQVFDLRLPRLYYDAFQICAMHGDEARASVFARRSREARTVCEGPESMEVEDLKKVEMDPSSFQNFGTTRKWKTTNEDVPATLGTEYFERWLWKKHVPMRS